MTDDLLGLARRAVDAAAAGEAVEAYATWGRELSVRAYDGSAEHLSSAESRGVGVRLIADGRMGYAYAADPSPDEVASLVAAARENAVCATPDEANVLPAPAGAEPLDGIYDPVIDSTPTPDKVEAALELERLMRAADPRVKAIRFCDYREVVAREAIASTTGIGVEAHVGACYVLANPVVADGDESQSGFAIRFARRPDVLDLEGGAEEAVDRARRLLGARKPATERLPVILDAEVAADLIGVVSQMVDAEEVLKGRSLLASKLGEQVASDVLTVSDDGRDIRSLAAAPFDEEGVPKTRTPVIERGVLRGFLHDTYTATRMQTSSTGNASRAGFKSPPGVSPNCLVVEPGSISLEQLLTRAPRALYVQEFQGLHSGVNPISGDFSVGVTGLLVDGGAFGQPVREATIASSLLDILQRVEAIGDDLLYQPSGVAAPTIMIGEMTVAGS